MGEGDNNSHSSEEVVDPIEKQKMQSKVDKRDLKNKKTVWKVAHLKRMHADKE